MYQSHSIAELNKPQLPSDLVPDGLYDVELATVHDYANSFGNRLAFVYEVTEGAYAGKRITQTAARSMNPSGKLAEILKGISGSRFLDELGLPSYEHLQGRQCKALVQTESNKSGKRYSNVSKVFK